MTVLGRAVRVLGLSVGLVVPANCAPFYGTDCTGSLLEADVRYDLKLLGLVESSPLDAGQGMGCLNDYQVGDTVSISTVRTTECNLRLRLTAPRAVTFGAEGPTGGAYAAAGYDATDDQGCEGLWTMSVVTPAQANVHVPCASCVVLTRIFRAKCPSVGSKTCEARFFASLTRVQ